MGVFRQGSSPISGNIRGFGGGARWQGGGSGLRWPRVEPRPRFIRQLTLLLAALCAGGLLICPSVANDESANAKALPGQRYDGTSASGDPIFLRATGGGDRLSTYRFAVRTRCGDGRRGYGALDQDGEGPARIAADGTFAYSTSRASDYRLADGQRIAGQSSFRLRGRFEPRGYAATGTIESRFRSRGLTCSSGPVPFHAYLDGSPGAPFRSRNITTGSYSDLPAGLDKFRFRVYLPSRAASTSFRWRQRCGSHTYSGRASIPSIPIGGRKLVHRWTRGRESYRLRLRFARQGNYLVYGEFSATIPRKRRKPCAVGPYSFTGVLAPGDGPLNVDPSGRLGPP